MAAIAEQPKVDLREPKGWRRTSNRIATALMVLAFVILIIPLGFVLFTVIVKGASVISWSFLTGSPIPPTVAPARPEKPKCSTQIEKMNRPITIDGTPVITSEKKPMSRASQPVPPYSLR